MTLIRRHPLLMTPPQPPWNDCIECQCGNNNSYYINGVRWDREYSLNIASSISVRGYWQCWVWGFKYQSIGRMQWWNTYRLVTFQPGLVTQTHACWLQMKWFKIIQQRFKSLVLLSFSNLFALKQWQLLFPRWTLFTRTIHLNPMNMRISHPLHHRVLWD